MSIPSIVYKAHATGNDFVVYLDAEGTYEPTADEVRFLCDRHFGIGGDGLIRLTHPQAVSDLNDKQIAVCAADNADWFMDYRNADGSLAEMCGNGTRAITLFAQRQGIAGQPGGEPFRLGTRAGVKVLTSLGDVPTLGKDVFQVEMGSWQAGIEDAFSSLPTVEQLDLVTKPVVAPRIESDQNVEFVRIDEQSEGDNEGNATMRVNERGCGETLSCGTGLCATAITLRAKTGIDHWMITVRGGTLRVDVTDNDVKLTGSATIVGKIELL